ncbi:hypothetical protein LUZ60_005603 [Juncus effusus]|nr:hypothetical protein LUZ60_005603 [Juncus effusus]
MGNSGSMSNNGEMDEGENRALNSIDLRRDCEDFMEQQIPKQMTHSSPLAFTPQIPVAPLEKINGIDSESNYQMNNNRLSDENNLFKEGNEIPTMVIWNHGGSEVFIQGSWDNWTTKKLLQKYGEEFYIVKLLPLGYYHCKFIVDGEFTYSPDFPSIRDENGNIYNILDVQEKAQENVENISTFNPPKSPESSYDNLPLNSSDFTKEPPELPRQLNLTLLNELNSQICQKRAPHVVLNHMYMERRKCDKSIVAIGETGRFLGKHVTVVLYKYLQG